MSGPAGATWAQSVSPHCDYWLPLVPLLPPARRAAVAVAVAAAAGRAWPGRCPSQSVSLLHAGQV